MRTVRAKRGQSLLDVALEHSGSADWGEDVAKQNGLAADYVCDGSEELEVPDGDEAARKRLAAAGVVPVTGTGDRERWHGIGVSLVGELPVK